VDALLRDIYFSGFYTKVLPEDRIVISEKLETLKGLNPKLFEDMLMSLSPSSKSNPFKSPPHVEKEKQFHNISEVKCVFCSVSKLTQKEMDFVIHPYVPKNFRNKFVYMCNMCIESWQVYRQTAQEENNLMLPGETNEEICAICSDSPQVGLQHINIIFASLNFYV